jgi:nicotinic acetylcholine receptor
MSFVCHISVDETKPATEVFPETHAIVSSEGKVLWVIPAMTKSSCKIDVTYFPFDEQRCPLKFGSWTYDGFQMDLVNLSESGDLTKYTVSGEWDLVGMPARRSVLFAAKFHF